MAWYGGASMGMEAKVNIPFDRVIWSASECAEYLGQRYSTFIKRTQYLDGFPGRRPIPGQPRWSAEAVTGWALGKSAESRTNPEPQQSSL